MTSLGKLESLLRNKQETEVKTVFFERTKLSLYHVVYNKQLMSTAPIVHWILPFCIALCSLELLGSVVLDERDHVLEFGDDAQ